MDTIWTWGWCLFPLIFFAVVAFACFAGARRCGCSGGTTRCGNGRNPPAPTAQQ